MLHHVIRRQRMIMPPPGREDRGGACYTQIKGRVRSASHPPTGRERIEEQYASTM
jgi:hypothetical protein